MQFQFIFLADLSDLFYFFALIATAAPPVTGILQADQRGAGLMHIIGIDGGGNLFGADAPAIPVDGAHLRAGVKGDAAALINIYMGIFLADDLVPGSRMTFYCDL